MKDWDIYFHYLLKQLELKYSLCFESTKYGLHGFSNDVKVYPTLQVATFQPWKDYQPLSFEQFKSTMIKEWRCKYDLF